MIQGTKVESKTHVRIAVGLAVAGAIAGIVGVSFALVQVSGDGGGGGGGSSTNTSSSNDDTTTAGKVKTPVALQAMAITSGFVVPDASAPMTQFMLRNQKQTSNLAQFSTESRQWGFAQPQKLTAPEPLVLVVFGAPIDPPDPTVPVAADISPMMVVLDYQDLNKAGKVRSSSITLCVGRSPTYPLFVATDGSTFTDAALTQRTTSEPCATIKSRAYKPTAATTGSGVSSEAGRRLGLLRDWPFVYPGYAVLDPHYEDLHFLSYQSNRQPVNTEVPAALFLAESSYSATAPVHVPAAMFAVQEVDKPVVTLCIPSTEVPVDIVNSSYRPFLFFGSDGTPYRDIFLSQRAMDQTCPEVASRAFAPTGIVTVSGTSTLPWDWSLYGRMLRTAPNLPYPNTTYPYFGALSRSAADAQVLNFYQWAQPTPSGVPLGIQAWQENAPAGTTSPNAQLSFGATTTSPALTLCVPQLGVPENSWYTGANGNPVFFDLNGRPYSDIFLTVPIECPSSGGAPPPTTNGNTNS